MPHPKLKKILSLLAVIIFLTLSFFWVCWGIFDKDMRHASNYQSSRYVKDYEEVPDDPGPGPGRDDEEEEIIESSFPERDEAIEKYLLTQKEFAWQTEEGSQNICVFENLSDKGDLFPLTIWVLCQEYKIENGKVKELSGVSGPVLIDYPNELSFFSIDRFTHKVPRDGSLYQEDVQNIFPEKFHNEIFTYRNRKILHNTFLHEILN